MNMPGDASQNSAMAPTILVIEDDQPTLYILQSTIQKWGYTVITAIDGESAWKMLQTEEKPELLVIDWQMPNLSGIELCQRIRSDLGADYHPYVILLTQSSGTDNIITGLEAGANEFLSKPVNLAELKSRISVGEKIIRYENRLSEQNTELKNYITKIEAASALARDASQSLNNAMQSGKKEKSTPHFHRLEEIDSNLNDILDIFNDFTPENTRKKKNDKET